METKQIKQLRKDIEKQYKRLEDAKAKLHYATISDAQFRIKMLEAQLQNELEHQPMPLSKILSKEQVDENKIVQTIIEMHPAADFLADSAMILRETLDKLGLDGCSLFPYVAEIKSKSEHFASLLCNYQPLSDFICDDDEYIEAAHKLTANYMAKTLKVE